MSSEKVELCPDCNKEMFNEYVCGRWVFYCDDCDIHFNDRWRNESERT